MFDSTNISFFILKYQIWEQKIYIFKTLKCIAVTINNLNEIIDDFCENEKITIEQLAIKINVPLSTFNKWKAANRIPNRMICLIIVILSLYARVKGKWIF